MKTKLALVVLAVVTLCSCAQSPYYLSGVDGGVDASKDGTRLTGGRVGFTFSPNPYYYPLPASKGLNK